MQNKFVISYTLGNTPLHRLTGATKVRLFLSLILLTIVIWDLRVTLPLLIVCLCGVVSTRPIWKPLKVIFTFVAVMNIVNLILYYISTPGAGLEWTGTYTPVYGSGRYALSPETLWYLGNRFIKMMASFMVCMAFILSITPSEFASGLASLRLPYKFCIIVELALRYIPDVLRDYQEISISAQCRGSETDRRKVSFIKRLRQSTLVIVPLILTSFGRISDIANAMDLRGFGKLKTRSWYCEREPGAADRVVQGIALFIVLVSVYVFLMRLLNPQNPQMWYPFNDLHTYNWRIIP
jgi:energy-coupling factor transport system permease protein